MPSQDAPRVDFSGLMTTRNLKKCDFVSDLYQKSEESGTLETEDFEQEAYSLTEALQTFEVGAQSSMFKILSTENEQHYISLRKQNAIVG